MNNTWISSFHTFHFSANMQEIKCHCHKCSVESKNAADSDDNREKRRYSDYSSSSSSSGLSYSQNRLVLVQTSCDGRSGSGSWWGRTWISRVSIRQRRVKIKGPCGKYKKSGTDIDIGGSADVDLSMVPYGGIPAPRPNHAQYLERYEG